MTHPVKDAASGLLRLTGTVLRGAGKITAGVVDAALVCSAVGALRRSKMRGVVKAAVKSAQKAVGEMIENIKDNGHADLRHTLNTIDLEAEDGLARSHHDDQYREDLFFRYNQTLQYFFDGSSRIDTRF